MPTMVEILRAIRESDVDSPVKCVLFTLTSLGDPRTGIIPNDWQPSLPGLAAMAGMGRSTLARHLVMAEKLGWLERVRPEGEEAIRQNDNTRYQVTVPPSQIGTGGSPESGQGAVPDRDGDTTPPVPDRDGAPSRIGIRTSYTGHTGLNLSPSGDDTHVVAPADTLPFDVPATPPPPPKRQRRSAPKTVTADDPKFQEFWREAYPRRKDQRARALTAWNKALKAGANPDEIIAGARRYAEERRAEDPQFTAMAATWLNNRGWEADDRPDTTPAAAPRVPADEQCPRHYGQRADACRLCAEEQTELAKEIAA